MKRVAITGVGVVTPIGIGACEFWKSAISGRSGVGPIRRFDASKHKCQIAAEIEDAPLRGLLEPAKARQLDRFAQFGLIAVKEAMTEAGGLGSYDSYRVGVSVGTGMGGFDTFENVVSKLHLEEQRVPTNTVVKTMANSAASAITMEFGFNGPTSTMATACSSGANAIGHAFRLIQWGQADAVITGGAEAGILPVTLAAFGELRALSTSFNDSPLSASRPFDRRRDGFVMGEGAGMLVLEEMQSAIDRGANIKAELVGCAVTSEALHIVAPDPTGKSASETMKRALSDARLGPSDVDLISAHATSTPAGDLAETNAIKLTFGERAGRIPVTAIKSLIGHTLGASGAIGTVAAVMAMNNGQIPPTINQETGDPQCDLDYVANVARHCDVRVALINSFAFGGNNVSLLVRRFEN